MSSFSSPLGNSNTSIKTDKGQHLQFLQYFVTWRFPEHAPVRCIDGHCFLFNPTQSVWVRPTLLLTTDGQPSEKRLGLISVRPHLGPSYTSYTSVSHIPHIHRSLIYLIYIGPSYTFFRILLVTDCSWTSIVLRILCFCWMLGLLQSALNFVPFSIF